jgi:ABC-type branched-subunit amino acid transport system ATPase component
MTGGWNGLSGIPTPRVLSHDFAEREMAGLIMALTALTLWLYVRLTRSRWGQAMRAVRDSETAAQSIGLDPVIVRATAFVISAVVAGIAGGTFAALSNYISPESFPFFQSIVFLLVVMIGGVERPLGPVIGSIIVVLLPEILSWLAGYRLLFVGILLLLVLRLAPGGFAGLFARAIGSTPRHQQVINSNPSAITALPQQGAGAGLKARDLHISFGGVQAVHGLTFEARPGAITSIIGPNGAGKSTVLNLACGYYRPDAGSIRLGDKDITALAPHAIARAGLARTYQTTQLFANMTAFENVLVALERGHLPIAHLVTAANRAKDIEVAAGLLTFVGYRGRPDAVAGSLPHIDKRLVEIARALATFPCAIALDEPAAGLNTEDKVRLGTLLTALAEAGLTVILVEHDMSLVMSVSHHVIVLDAGAKIAEGTPQQVAQDARVLKAYLGEERQTDRGRKTPVEEKANKVLTVSGLSSGYGGISVIRDIDLEVAQGEFVAVLGANGAGKTTLMRALAGLNRPIEGEVALLSERIDKYPANVVARRGLALVPEGRQVFPELSVIDNLHLGAGARPSADFEGDVERLFERFPRLRERARQRAGLLSGGEQQMLAIARGLISRPRVLLLDEPSLGLAPMLVEELYDLMAELRDDGTTVLLVDQVAGLALSIADRAYVLRSGRVTRSAKAAELRADSTLAQAYLGEIGEKAQ